MRLSRTQLRRLIMEEVSLMGKPEGGGDAYGQYPDHIKTKNQKQQYDMMKAPERRKAKVGKAKMPQAVIDIASEIVQMIPGVDEAVDATKLVYHTQAAASDALNGDFEGSKGNFIEAGASFAFLLSPGIIEGLIKLLRLLAKKGSSLVKIVESLLSKMKKDQLKNKTAKDLGGLSKSNAQAALNKLRKRMPHDIDAALKNIPKDARLKIMGKNLPVDGGKYKGYTLSKIDSAGNMYLETAKGEIVKKISKESSRDVVNNSLEIQKFVMEYQPLGESLSRGSLYRRRYRRY